MSASKLLANTRNRIDEDWDDFAERALRAAAEARTGVASERVVVLDRNELPGAVIAAPEKLAAIGESLRPMIEAAIREEDAAAQGELAIHVIPVMSAANAIECVGVVVSSSTRATMAAWIPRLSVKRDDERASWYWTTAFASLVLCEPRVYRGFAGVDPEHSAGFQAGQTFGLDLQGFARHLAGAIETRANVESVLPAFREVIQNFSNHRASASATEHTLLWMARAVFERVGGSPTGEVAHRLHETLVEIAGAS